MADSPEEAIVAFGVEKLSQLFEPLDPFPVSRRDLSGATEEFIVAWAGELPRKRSIRLIVNAPASEVTEGAARQLAEAFINHFSSRADGLRIEIRKLFSIGRWSLLIGVAVLALCVVAGQLADQQLGDGYVGRVFSEGVLIFGWVASWRPIEIFLYDWRPLMLRRRLYLRLSRATVERQHTEDARMHDEGISFGSTRKIEEVCISTA